MSRDKSQQTDEQKQALIYDFLHQNRAGVLTSVDPNGDPHGSVIYFTVNQQFEVRFLTKSRTKKYENIKHNNRVMLVVFEPQSQTVAQVLGKAYEIEDSNELNSVAAAISITSIRTSDGGIPPISKLKSGEYRGFRIEPVQVRYASYAKTGSGDYQSIFESIESFSIKA